MCSWNFDLSIEKVFSFSFQKKRERERLGKGHFKREVLFWVVVIIISRVVQLHVNELICVEWNFFELNTNKFGKKWAVWNGEQLKITFLGKTLYNDNNGNFVLSQPLSSIIPQWIDIGLAWLSSRRRDFGWLWRWWERDEFYPVNEQIFGHGVRSPGRTAFLCCEINRNSESGESVTGEHLWEQVTRPGTTDDRFHYCV